MEHVHERAINNQEAQIQRYKLVIWRYWSDLERMQIGYANTRWFLWLITLQFGVMIAALGVDLLFHYGLGAPICIASMLLVASRAFREDQKYNGYYEVSKTGEPIRMIANSHSVWPLETPLGSSMSRKSFLSHVQG